MIRGGIPIGRVLGIALRIHYTWFFIFALVTWSLAADYFPLLGWSTGLSVTAGLITSLLFFASVLAHELMHSIVARSAGIPVHSITLFIFGGVSQMDEEPKRPKDELRMAIAGPLTSLVLGLIFWGLWYWVGPTSEFALGVTAWLAVINIALVAFNLIPGFPLDGGRVLRSILWWRSNNLRRSTYIASTIGRGVGFLFILGGILVIFTTGLWLNGMWFILIGWFLENAAGSSYRQMALQETLKGHTASEAMTRECPTVTPDTSVQQLVNDHVLATGRRCFPVATEGGRILGLVTLHDIRAVPRDAWSTRTARDAMTPLEKMKAVGPEEDLATVMRILAEEDINQIMVMEDGRVTGAIGRDTLLSFISLRGELGV